MVISLDLAKRLRDAGVRWEPAPGDKFVLPDRGMDDEVFVLSNMTIDVHDFPTGRVIGFNGTVEWALDSVEEEAALWLPSEEQLRDLLGGTFVRLYRSGDQYGVTLEIAGRVVEVVAGDPPEAYGRALLYLADGKTGNRKWISHASSHGRR